jgi:hypothetical protein
MSKRNRSVKSSDSLAIPNKMIMEVPDNNASIIEIGNSVLKSTEKFEVELYERCKLIDEAIKQLDEKDNPTIKDMANALVILMTSHKEAIAEQNSLKKQLFSLTKKTIENSISIKNMQNELCSDALHLNAKLNRIEQHKIDDEISISGFPSKPDHKFATENFCKIFGIPTNKILRSFAFEFTNKKANKKEGQVVIKFHSKSDHIHFNKLKKQKGPILISQLMDGSSTDLENTPVKIFNRLTKVNRSIIASLRKYQKEERILENGIRYRNCSFEIKTDANADFQEVPSLDHLKLLFV